VATQPWLGVGRGHLFRTIIPDTPCRAFLLGRERSVAAGSWPAHVHQPVPHHLRRRECSEPELLSDRGATGCRRAPGRAVWALSVAVPMCRAITLIAIALGRTTWVALIHCSKCRWSGLGLMQAKTRPKASCEGMPFGISRNISSQTCLLLLNSVTVTWSLTLQIMARMVIMVRY